MKGVDIMYVIYVCVMCMVKTKSRILLILTVTLEISGQCSISSALPGCIMYVLYKCVW